MRSEPILFLHCHVNPRDLMHSSCSSGLAHILRDLCGVALPVATAAFLLNFKQNQQTYVPVLKPCCITALFWIKEF